MKINNIIVLIGVALSVIVPTLAILFGKKTKMWAMIVLVCYLIVTAASVFTKVDITKTYTQISIVIDKSQAFNFKNCMLGNLGFSNVIINVLMLIPTGICIYAISKKHKLLNCVIYGFVISFAIEFLQLALPINRNTELFDLVANTISSLAGGLWAMLMYCIKSKIKGHTN